MLLQLRARWAGRPLNRRQRGASSTAWSPYDMRLLPSPCCWILLFTGSGPLPGASFVSRSSPLSTRPQIWAKAAGQQAIDQGDRGLFFLQHICSLQVIATATAGGSSGRDSRWARRYPNCGDLSGTPSPLHVPTTLLQNISRAEHTLLQNQQSQPQPCRVSRSMKSKRYVDFVFLYSRPGGCRRSGNHYPTKDIH